MQIANVAFWQSICTTVLTSLNDSIKELLEPINLLALEQIKTICEPLNLISKEANLSSISNLSLITPSIDDPISEMKKNASDFNSQIN